MPIKKRKIAKQIFKTVKNTIMNDSDNNKNKAIRTKHADTIIRNHVIWSMGAGLIPVLIADIFAVSALQLDMIRQLCKVYDVDFKETQGKAVVTSLTSSTLARLGARSVIKLIPGVGSLIGGAAVSIFAGSSTYALGEVFKLHFETGGTILDFDPERLKNRYKEMFEKGKSVASDLKETTAEHFEEIVEVVDDAAENVMGTVQDMSDDFREEMPAESAVTNHSQEPVEKDVLTKLSELGELKEKGFITEEEFVVMKKKLISDF
ncbi:MAG: hypothetical protein ACI8YQ_003113 [Polaribacter sp.]|jgi:uncharacterized protein (DUF697 family)